MLSQQFGDGIDVESVDVLLSQLDIERQCTSHCMFSNATVDPPDARLRSPETTFIGQCIKVPGHDGQHCCEVPRRKLRRNLMQRFFRVGNSSGVTMTWESDMGPIWRPSDFKQPTREGDEREVDRLCQRWWWRDESVPVGSTVYKLAEQILKDEFSRFDYRQSLGAALVDGVGQWKDEQARCAFTSGGAETVRQMCDKLRQVFRGVFATTRKHFPAFRVVE